MPRRKLYFMPGRENEIVDCFAFRLTKGGRPECTALTDIYCLKSPDPCPFRVNPAEAEAARKKARGRLIQFGYR